MSIKYEEPLRFKGKTHCTLLTIPPPKLSSDSDDHFFYLRKLCIYFGYHPATKLFNKYCIYFHSLIYLLQLCHIFTNFSQDLVTRYSTMILVITYVSRTWLKFTHSQYKFQMLTTMVFSIVLEKNVWTLLNSSNSMWSLTNADTKTLTKIKEQSSLTNMGNYTILGCVVMATMVNLPLFGRQDELFISEHIFRVYLGRWYIYMNWAYFTTFPFLFYTAFRLCFILLYAILRLKTQIILFNNHIKKISDDFDSCDELKSNTMYQREMKTRLRFCIREHINMKEFIHMLNDTVRVAMPFFLVLGLLCTASFLFFILNFFDTMSQITKVRLFFFIFSNLSILAVFCIAGQGLLNETGRVFDVVMECPWHMWDLKNKKTLLNLLTNSLKPFGFSFAGIGLDYKLALSMVKTALSYAMIMYKVRKAN